MNNILPELIGVVACGGNSSRMGKDKSLLNYNGKPQRYFLYELLNTFCKDVFISCNILQSEKIQRGYQFFVDNEQYENNGPISGLLSAHLTLPQRSILYVGCDYPFMDPETIQELISNRNNISSVICFKNPENQIIEPLITIYENNCFHSLLKQYNQNKFSLRKFIENKNANYLTPKNSAILKSIDTPEEYKTAIESIRDIFQKQN